MTTHDQQTTTEFVEPIDPETSRAPMEVPDTQSGPPVHSDAVPAESVPQSAEVESSPHVEPAEPEAVPPITEVEPSGDESLFAADLSGLRARWDDIQVAFVDDPSGCVQKADGLVEEVIEQLTSRFADARSRLEQQWARGEDASTEDLRLALTHYREFFQRLLAV